VSFINDKESARFEYVKLNVVNYGSKVKEKYFLWSTLNPTSGNVKRFETGKNPLKYKRYYDVDEIEIKLPTDFKIESLPVDFEINSKFVNTQFSKKDANSVSYKRFMDQKRFYTNKEYDEYRLFMEQISRNDNAKIILTPIKPL
jgi:hypothetical protein